MRVLILGGGIAGLNCLAHLRKKHDVTLIEKGNRAGGLLRSFSQNGFTFDLTGHLIHSLNGEFRKFLNSCDLTLESKKRRAAVHIDGSYVDYPIQLNVSQLDNDLKHRITDEILKTNPLPVSEETDFESWVRSVFGDTLAEKFFIPYNGKLFLSNISNVSSNWFSRYLPFPDKTEFVRSLATGGTANAGYNAEFKYPSHGGISVIPEALFSLLKEDIHLNEEVEEINIEWKKVTTPKAQYEYDILISTIPFPVFMKLSELKIMPKPSWVNVYDLNVGVSNSEFPYHWAYYPGEGLPFYRIGSFSNISSSLAPVGSESFYIETAYLEKKPDREEILDAVENLGIFKKSDIQTFHESFLEYAYPIHDREYQDLMRSMRSLGDKDVYFFGRSGGWKYLSISDIFNSAGHFIKGTVVA